MADTYRIVSQTDTKVPGPTGAYVDAVEVTFETIPSGITGRVVIPEAEFSPDKVAPLVARKAADREAIANL
jgi:hypothetical protein